MERHHKFSLWYVLIAIWIVMIAHSLIMQMFSVEHIPYSRFIEALKAGEVVEVSVSQDHIRGRRRITEGAAETIRDFETVRVDPGLSDLLQQYDVQFKGVVASQFWQNIFSWFVPVLFFFGIWYFMMRRFSSQQGNFLSLGKGRARIYMEDDVGVSFADVAGVDEAKDELVEVIQFLKTPDKYTRLGGKIPKGVLLVGPPGTGKTLLAKAVAGESGVPFFSMSGSEFVELFVGMGAARVRDLFSQAKTKAPCIIFIDELDALGKARGIAGAYGGNDEREQTLNQLLVEMDGFDSSAGIIMLAATNRPEILDPALLRAGRFDRQVLVDRPDKQGRADILKVHLQGVEVGGDVDIDAVAAMTTGFVGADLANLVNEAALLAVRNGRDRVSLADLREAVERIVAGLEKKNRLINPRERQIVAHHEIGHALVALSLPGSDPVTKITIVPRGVAALGYTMQTPTEDRFLMTRSELLDKIAVLLGGRAAEELVFEDVSTGGQNDLAKATDIARSLVMQYGMSREVGQVVYERSGHRNPLGLPQGQVPEYSEHTAETIDRELRAIMEEQYTRAGEILSAHRQVLRAGAEVLLREENIEGATLKELLERERDS